jgi:hypothetical protein
MRQAIWLALGMLASSASPATEQRFTVEQLQQDVRFIRQSIGEIHPEPGFSVVPEQLDKALDAAQQRLSVPMSRDDAWRSLARLNPVFSDAHFALVQPDWRAQGEAWLASGGVLFPYEVQATADGKLFVRAALGGGVTSMAGMPVDSVNGVPAKRLVQELLQLVHGDTPQFRAEVLSRRWWFYYWKLHGAPSRYVFSHKGEPMDVAGSRARPEAIVGADESDFGHVFRFELLGKRAALLTINQFSWPDKEKFYAFTAAAFARIREAGVTTLLIDVRENPGGDDDMWKQGVLPYIATRPYRHTSTYVKKVIPGRASGSERVGDIVRGKLENWESPAPGNPLRFNGRVYVLVGGMTYSSAVLFSNVMQDFKFGQLVGTGGYARARQSGGIQIRSLPNTGLELVLPRFILDRPAGDNGPTLVQPDIPLHDDPFNRRALIDALLQRVGQDLAAAPEK